jgi:hypothetical protein
MLEKVSRKSSKRTKFKPPEHLPESPAAAPPAPVPTLDELTAQIVATYNGMQSDLDAAKAILKSGTAKMIDLGNFFIAAEPLYKAERLTLDEYIEKRVKPHVKKLAPSTAHMAKRIARRLNMLPDMREDIVNLPILEADRLLTRAYRLLEEKLAARQSTEKDDHTSLSMELRNWLAGSDVLRRTKSYLKEDGWRNFAAQLPEPLSEAFTYFTTDFSIDSVPELPQPAICGAEDEGSNDDDVIAEEVKHDKKVAARDRVEEHEDGYRTNRILEGAV